MKINTTELPKHARLFIKDANTVLFDGVVYEHDDSTQYKSTALVRSRLFGMCPIEFDGSNQESIDEFKPIGYRELLIPDACPNLPYNEEAKANMEQAMAEELTRETVQIGHE